MKPEILIIDDDPVVQSILATMLGEERFQITVLGTGAEGIANIKDGGRPTLVFLDLQLTDMTGFDVLTEIKKEVADLTVVMVSANKREEILEHNPDPVPDYFLEKPFTLADVNSLLELVIPE